MRVGGGGGVAASQEGGFLVQASCLIMGPKRGSLGTSFVSVDWLVKVFWSYGLVYIPSDQIYVHTTPVSGCMYRHSRYIPFYSQS